MLFRNVPCMIRLGIVCLLSLLTIAPITAEQGKKYGKLYLKEYQPKTAEETAIIKTLIQYEAAFNTHDLRSFVSCFTKDAIYMPCGDGVKRPIASKDCQDIVVRNFGSFGFETYYDPSITVNGSKAVVKLLIETGVYLADYTFNLSMKDQEWLVSEAEYTNDHLKGM
jgi:hypothetical protein